MTSKGSGWRRGPAAAELPPADRAGCLDERSALNYAHTMRHAFIHVYAYILTTYSLEHCARA
jgi:hypothetical protein